MHEKGRFSVCLFCSLSTRGQEEEAAEGAAGGSGVREGEARGGGERQKEGWRDRRRDGAMLGKPSWGMRR